MSIAAASQDVLGDDLAPPPLRLLSEDEKSKLAAETKVKDRTKLTLELMEVRLARAEALNAELDHDQMFVALGAFHGLMDNLLQFLTGKDQDSGRVLNNLKRFEIGLRKFTPRLEILRRELPTRYEFYVRVLIKNLRDARTKAVEPLFDDTVVPSNKPQTDPS